MTYEEAHHILENTKIILARNNGKILYAEALTKAIEALEYAERYRWHDLRKNENDFPTEEEIKQFHFVLAYSDSQKKYNICESKVLKLYICNYGNYAKITRWKFIEP